MGEATLERCMKDLLTVISRGLLSLSPPSVSVLPVLCYYVILPVAGYSGNVDLYSLSLQRYEIRYCKDLTFLILSNTNL